ncbi:MAG TPA: transposase [Polyangia bacterium]|jgi:transposase|nr:transposase [Polyangia bacterium]
MHAGIAVTKRTLDLATSTGATRHVANDDAGITALVADLDSHAPTLVILDATAAHQAPLVAALIVAKIPTAVLDPRPIRDFAKTDTLTATILARFAETTRPEPRAPTDELTDLLQALLTRRRELAEMIAAEEIHIQRFTKSMRPRIKASLNFLMHNLADMNRELDAAVRASPVWRDGSAS